MKKLQIQKHLSALVFWGVVLAWRFYQIRDLTLPPWVDSVHHALLVRILLEQRTIPKTWAPYLPQVPFYYHFGFHVTAAALAAAANISAAKAVLIAGQVWQALLALSVYLLGHTLWKNSTKALVAMVLVGFVSQMPAYYTTWGRYTLLAGLTILIAGMAAALAGRNYLVVLLVAAAAITHFYAFFLLAVFLFFVFAIRPHSRRAILLALAGGIILASPWLWLVLKNVYQQHLAYVQTSVDSAGYSTEYMLYLLGPARNYVLLLLAGIGIIVTVYRLKRPDFTKNYGLVVFLLWTSVLLLMTGPWRFGPFRPDHHAALVLFLPAVILATEALWRVSPPVLRWGGITVLLAWGVWQTGDIINPDTILVNGDDLLALEWIETNTPPTANFLIDVVPWSAQWRGGDGGWWITPYTGRQTVLPPAVYGWGPAQSVNKIRATAARVYGLNWNQGMAYCHQLATLMAENQVTYFYTRSPQSRHCPQLVSAYEGNDNLTIYQITGALGNLATTVQ